MSEMKAGRELDKCVAEQVMGWTVQRRATGNLMAILPDNSRLCIEHVHGVVPAAMWNPSEDIAAAFEVVTRLETLGVHLVIWPAPKIVHAYKPTEDEYESEAQGDTVAHAVCLAALKAVSCN